MRGDLRALVTALGIFIALMSFGCGEVGILAGGRDQTFSGRETLELKTPRTDILDVVAEVGKSMGYDVSSLDKKANTISLSSGSSLLTTMLIGKVNQATLTVFSKDNGANLDVHIMVMGNFGAGGQAEATKIMDDFRTKLSIKIGQQF